MRIPAAYSLLHSLTLALSGGHHPVARAVLLALLIVAALWLLLDRATPALAAGVVTSCGSDSDLRTKLAGGGLVTFNCNGNGSSATITVTQPITLTTGQVTLDGGNKITLSGRNTNRIFFLNGIGSLSLTLTHIVLTRGFDFNAGGCLYAAADRVVLDDVTVQQCSSAVPTGEGGGISNLFSDFHLVNSRVLSNTAGTGGGIANSSAPMTLTNSLIAASLAITGGGLSVRNGSAFITASTFYSNAANVLGGGIFIRNTGRATVLNSSLMLNQAFGGTGGGGGGIYNANRLTLSDSVLGGNRAGAGLGGGLNNQNIASVDHTTFDGNVAQYGGGIHNDNGGSLVVTQTRFTANEGFFNGGGINNFGDVQMITSTLSGNSANFGGGIDNTRTLMATNVTINGNEADFGGGISNGFLATLVNVTLSGNTATNVGGGLFNGNSISVVTMTHVTISGNGAPNGGGIFQGAAVTRLKSSIVANSLSGDNCRTGGGTLTSDDYNLSDDDSCTPFFTHSHDLNKTPALLGPLANNGGPTLTHLPLASSLAVDAVPVGTNGCGTTVTIDQRGVLRPQGGAKCDMGAVERTLGELTPFLWLPLILR